MEHEKEYDMDGYALVGAAIEVYQVIGGGVHEEIYHESMAHEFGYRDIPFESKKRLMTFYKGKELTKIYYPDYFTHNRIIAELKAVAKLESAHEAQLLNYMRLSKTKVGYLINFGRIDGLEWKRFVL